MFKDGWGLRKARLQQKNLAASGRIKTAQEKRDVTMNGKREIEDKKKQALRQKELENGHARKPQKTNASPSESRDHTILRLEKGRLTGKSTAKPRWKKGIGLERILD